MSVIQRGPRKRSWRFGVLDECYSGIPFLSATGLMRRVTDNACVMGCISRLPPRVNNVPATCFAFASGLANIPAFTPYTLHKKIALQGDFSCTIQNISLPLQPQTQIGLCRHIIKRRLLALVLVCRNPENFVTQYKRAINAP